MKRNSTTIEIFHTPTFTVGDIIFDLDYDEQYQLLKYTGMYFTEYVNIMFPSSFQDQ